MTRTSVPVRLGPLVGVGVTLLAVPLVAWVVNRFRQCKEEEEANKTETSGATTANKDESEARTDTASAQGASVSDATAEPADKTDNDAGADADAGTGADEQTGADTQAEDTPVVEASEPDAPADPMEPTLSAAVDADGADTTTTEADGGDAATTDAPASEPTPEEEKPAES